MHRHAGALRLIPGGWAGRFGRGLGGWLGSFEEFAEFTYPFGEVRVGWVFLNEFEDFGGCAVGLAEGGHVAGAVEEHLRSACGVELGGLVAGSVGGDAVRMEFYLEVPSGEKLGVAGFAPRSADVHVEDTVEIARAEFPGVFRWQPGTEGKPFCENAFVDRFVEDVAGFLGNAG